MQGVTLRILALFIPAVSLIAGASELPAQQKSPIPNAQAQRASQDAAADVYGERFQRATSAAAKTALAAEMIEAALDVPGGATRS